MALSVTILRSSANLHSAALRELMPPSTACRCASTLTRSTVGMSAGRWSGAKAEDDIESAPGIAISVAGGGGSLGSVPVGLMSGRISSPQPVSSSSMALPYMADGLTCLPNQRLHRMNVGCMQSKHSTPMHTETLTTTAVAPWL